MKKKKDWADKIAEKLDSALIDHYPEGQIRFWLRTDIARSLRAAMAEARAEALKEAIAVVETHHGRYTAHMTRIIAEELRKLAEVTK